MASHPLLGVRHAITQAQVFALTKHVRVRVEVGVLELGDRHLLQVDLLL